MKIILTQFVGTRVKGCKSIYYNRSMLFYMYSNPSVSEQEVYAFSLIRDAQTNNWFSIYELIFSYTSSFLSQTDRCPRRLFSGSYGKLVFVLRVFALRAALVERFKLVNRGITVFVFMRRQIPIINSTKCLTN
jgi:hypothetical protein